MAITEAPGRCPSAKGNEKDEGQVGLYQRDDQVGSQNPVIPKKGTTLGHVHGATGMHAPSGAFQKGNRTMYN